MKYYIIRLTVHDGEWEYNDYLGMGIEQSKTEHPSDYIDNEAIKRAVENWGGSYSEIDDYITTITGQIVEIEAVTECTQQEYETISKYITL